MMLRLRVEVADRPGALAELARTLADAGGDIVQVTVMQRGDGVAVDDLWMSVATERDVETVRSAVVAMPQVGVLGMRRSAVPVEFDAQLDFLAYLFAAPHRGAEAFVEMLPSVVDADWAAILSGGGAVVHDSGDAIPGAADKGTDHVAELALAAGTLVVGRAGMSWHQAELRRIASVLELGALLLRHAVPTVRQPVTSLTASVAAESRLALA
jgi:ACT domain